MSQDMLGVAPRDFREPLKTLIDRLMGDDSAIWLARLNKFNRSENPFEIQTTGASGEISISTKKRTLTVLRSITSGGKTAKELMRVVRDVGELGDYAKSMIENKQAFRPASEATSVSLVAPTLRELGFTENPRTDDFMTKEFCAKWSAENLDGYVIELCRAEDGPHLRIEYLDQPDEEVLWMAMERITDSDGYPFVFRVERDHDGVRWLGSYWTGAGVRWGLGRRIVFRLRKL